MDGHHLVMGEIRDFLTGAVLPDTHDERYRQRIARLLVTEKGFDRHEIKPRRQVTVRAGEKEALVEIDFLVEIGDTAAMLIRYGPGSLVTRHRPALAASRLVAPYQVPLVVVTNGEDAHVLEGKTGKRLGTGLEAIPARNGMDDMLSSRRPEAVSARRAMMESRVLYAYDIDGSCACDDGACRS